MYGINDLHSSVNDIHEQWDRGMIEYKNAQELLVKCCEEFIKQSKEKQNE